jgi:hypothetical protein
MAAHVPGEVEKAMAKIEGLKYSGVLTVDLKNVEHALVDLAPGATRGARGEQEGMADVEKELAAAMPTHGPAVDVSAQVYDRFVARSALLVDLREKEGTLRKLLEVVEETRIKTENDREDDLASIAKAVRTVADRQKDPSLTAPFEKTLRYYSQIADKAVQTRKKNAEAKGVPPVEGAPKVDPQSK